MYNSTDFVQFSFSSRSIIAGDYVVNDCPFEAFGALNEYIRILNDRGKEIGREECAIDGETPHEDVVLTMLVDIGKEGDEVCNESMCEVLNEDGVLHEVDVHENTLSESKCDVAIDGEKKEEDVTLTMLVDVRKESNQVIDVHEKALSELSLML